MSAAIKMITIAGLFFMTTGVCFAQTATPVKPELTESMQKYLKHFSNLLELLDKNENDPVLAEKEFPDYQKSNAEEMEVLLKIVQSETDSDIEMKILFSREFQNIMRKILQKLKIIHDKAEKKQAEENYREKTDLPGKKI